LEIALIVVAVFFVGFLIGMLVPKGTEVGTLLLNNSNPSKELFSIRFEKDIMALKDGSDVIFKLKIE